MKSSTLLMFALWACLVADLFIGNVSENLQPASMYDAGITIVLVMLLFGWFMADAKDLEIRPSPLLKAGVILLSALAVPYYLIRYKGWKKSLGSFGIFGGFLVVYLVLGSIVV